IDDYELLPDLSGDGYSNDLSELLKGSEIQEVGVDVSRLIPNEEQLDRRNNLFSFDPSNSLTRSISGNLLDNCVQLFPDQTVDPADNLISAHSIIRLGGVVAKLDANNVEMQISLVLGLVDFPEPAPNSAETDAPGRHLSFRDGETVLPLLVDLVKGGGLACGMQPSARTNYRDGWIEIEMKIRQTINLQLPKHISDLLALWQARTSLCGGAEHLFSTVTPVHLIPDAPKELPKLPNRLPDSNLQSFKLTVQENFSICFDNAPVPPLLRRVNLPKNACLCFSKDGQLCFQFDPLRNADVTHAQKTKLENNALQAENNVLKEKLDSLLSQMALMSAELSTTKCALAESKRHHADALSKMRQFGLKLHYNSEELKEQTQSNSLPSNGATFLPSSSSLGFSEVKLLRQRSRTRMPSTSSMMYGNRYPSHFSRWRSSATECKDLLANVTLQTHYTTAIVTPSSQIQHRSVEEGSISPPGAMLFRSRTTK
ncbi:hypothetical protein Ciccas_009272, partial [Cichlidogyrus casuarinus]